MGHQIHAGGTGIHFTNGSWQVVEWCEKYTPKVKPSYMTVHQWYEETCGSTNIDFKDVILANEKVPTNYEEAKAAGLIRENIDERSFEECRDFLTYAAVNGHDIHGSW